MILVLLLLSSPAISAKGLTSVLSPSAFSRFVALTVGLLLVLTSLAVMPAAAIVPDEVRVDLPIVLDGRVYAVSQIGNRVIVGGDFQQVRTGTGGTVIDQPYIFAYNIDTGEFDEDFHPVLDGEVRDIENDPDGRHIYFSGKFKNVDDYARGRIARYDVRDHEVDGRFRGRSNSKVESIAVLGDGLVVGGNFTVMNNEPREYLALVDRKNGKVLEGFNVDFGEAIGRTYTQAATGDKISTAGVHRVQVRPGASNKVLVQHRHDSVDGQASPALAMFNEIGTLHPWRTDVYGVTNCGSRGVSATDVSWSPDGSHFAVGHTGHDTGMVCDSLVKFSFDQTTPGDEVRQPIWSSRVFDSIFAVEYSDDAIYLGGHFRYLVHPDAPSTYPGGATYSAADPELNTRFKTELVDPGYVFVANQIGAIDPTSGKGIPTWLPTSNAAKGILTMTMSERGLLIGQDNGQVSGVTTGRSAVFDPTPEAGNINCSVSLSAAGNPVVRWSDIADSGEPYRIRRNDRWLAAVTNLSVYTDTETVGGETAAYTMSYRRYDETIEDVECGTVTSAATSSTNLARTGTVSQSSVLGSSFASRAIDGNITQAAITESTTDQWLNLDLGNHADISAISLWNGAPADLEDVSIFVSASEFESDDVNEIRNQAKMVELTVSSFGQNKRFTNNLFARYIRVYTPTGALAIGELEVLGTSRETIECQATAISYDTIRVTWDDVDAARYAIAYEGKATSVGLSTTQDINIGINPGDHEFEVRAFANSARIGTTTCTATMGVPEIGCTSGVTNGFPVLRWNDIPWSSVSIARNGSYITSATGDTVWADSDALTGTQTYEVRVRTNGTLYVGSCGSVTLP